MTYYPDLENCDYFGAEAAQHYKAVGWLSSERDFTTGKVSEEFFIKLCQLLQNPWNPPIATAGVHFCELCQFTTTGIRYYRDFKISSVSNKSLFVPGEGVIYVAPESIAHYIDAHYYKPPDEFRAAVIKCPEMRSIRYLKMILANDWRQFMKL